MPRKILRAWRWWIAPIAIVALLWTAAVVFHQRDEGSRRTYTVM